MQSQRDETLRTLLSDLYRDDSSVDLEKLSSQLLQILSESSADDDVPISSFRWREDDAVLILMQILLRMMQFLVCKVFVVW